MKSENTLKLDTVDFPLRDITDNIIHAFQAEEMDCVLAGGWLRDAVYKIPGKDLDFFIHDPKNLSCYLREEGLFDLLGFDMEEGDTYTWEGKNYANKVLTINRKNQTYQFIFTKHNTKSHIKNLFDYSFNQVYYDGAEIQASSLFKKTYKTGVVSLLCDVPQHPKLYEAFVKRQEYLKSKYPQLTFPEIPKLKPIGARASEYIDFGFNAATGQKQHNIDNLINQINVMPLWPYNNAA